jgi:hypothetical protein
MTICPLQHTEYQTLAIDLAALITAGSLDLVALVWIWSFWRKLFGRFAVSLRAKREKSGIKPQGLGKMPDAKRATKRPNKPDKRRTELTRQTKNQKRKGEEPCCE